MSVTEMQDWNACKRQALETYFGRMNDMQRRAVFQINGPLLILAGAGSGKTTVLISRIENMVRFGNAYHTDTPPAGPAEQALLRAYINGQELERQQLERILAHDPVRPWNILAITFTNKAAGELKARLEQRLGDMAQDVHASTFHSLCVRILRRDIESLGYSRNFTIYDTDDSLRVIKNALAQEQIDEKLLQPRAVLSAIGRAKDRMQSAQAALAAAGDNYREQCVARVYARYQQMLKAANALDFDDIIVNTVLLLQQSPQVLEYYQNRFRYIMVDEYQDTNHAQYLLVSLLAAGHRNLCVVGDDDQSIYKFRGATIENILSFENQFENATVIRLEQNYRSTQNILSAANGVISHNTERKGKNLWTSFGDGEKVQFVRLRDENEESRYIAERILENVKGGARFSDHAVLYRMNAQSNSVEKSLARSGIPYRIVGGLRFYERKEIKDMVAYLSVLNNPGDALRLVRIVNEPKRGIGSATLAAAQEIAAGLGVDLFEVLAAAQDYPQLAKKSAALHAFTDMMRRFMEMAEAEPLDVLFDRLLEDSGYLAMLKGQGFEGEGRIENLLELKSNIVKYMQEAPEPSLAGFLEEIALYTDLDAYDANEDSVVLMTVHSAKGLEFPCVFIAGMDDGIFPGRTALSYPAEIEEERRLAYVAITRAKTHLTITSAEHRLLFGQTIYSRPSRFVAEIPAAHVECTDKTGAATRSAAQRPTRRQPSASLSTVGVGKPVAARASGWVPQTGERVLHKTFGEGTVLASRPMGNDTLLEIAFDRAGAKKIMANYARLEKI